MYHTSSARLQWTCVKSHALAVHAVEDAAAGGDKLRELEAAAGAGAAGGERERATTGGRAPIRALRQALQHR